MAYFLIKGRARLIQHLLLLPRVSSTGLVKYRCLPPGTPARSTRRQARPDPGSTSNDELMSDTLVVPA